MALIFEGKTECVLCHKVLWMDDDIVATSHFIGDPNHPFWQYSDAPFHRRCFLAWNRRLEFVNCFNSLARLSHGQRPQMQDDGSIIDVDDNENAWDLLQSRQDAQQRAQLEQEFRRRREDLSSRMEAVRQKAIRLGIANLDNVDTVIHDLPPDEFRRHFSEFHVSRAFFKRAVKS